MKIYSLFWLIFSLPLFLTFTANSQTTFQKTYGGTKDDVANWVSNTSTGYMVAGYSTTLNGDRNGYLLNLDLAGNVIWQKMMGGALGDQFNVVHETSDGFMVLGETQSFGAAGGEAWLLKFGVDGTVLWTKRFGDSTATQTANSMTPVSGGRFLLSGVRIPSGMTAPNSWFALVDSLGGTVWSRYYESGETGNILRSNYVENGVIYASGIIQVDAGLLRLELETGDFIDAMEYASDSTAALYYLQPAADSNLLLSDHTRPAAGGFQMKQWVNKVTNNGQTIWSKVYSRPNNNLRGRIERAGNDHFLLTPYDGLFDSNADALLAKIDGAGNVVWSRNYGRAGADWLWKSQMAPDSGFISVGTSIGLVGDRDVLVLKTDAEGLVAGCCIQPGDIIAEDYQHPDSVQSVISFNWLNGTDEPAQADDADLQTSSYCGVLPLEITLDTAQCPNIAVNVNGVDHFAPDQFDITLPGVNGCDTIVHYNLTALPQVNQVEIVSLCPGDSVFIGGQLYTQADTVVFTFPIPNSCDSLQTFIIGVLPQPVVSQTILFCAGDSILIDGQIYTQSGTVIDTVAGIGACDTIVTYTLTEVLQQVRFETISFCPGDSITINGQVYTQSDVAIDTIAGINACDTIVTYTLTMLPQPTASQSISFCPGDSITINGQVYTQSGIALDTIAGVGACDTIVTYTLTLLPQPSQTFFISFCPGDSITINGQVFTQSGTALDTLAGNGACDTIVTYTLTLLPQPMQAFFISFCPGDSITINGQLFTQSGTALDTLAGNGACDTIVTYTLTLLPNPTLTDSITFCIGDSITINGQVYTQSAVVNDTISGNGACDTIVTYILTLQPQQTRSETVLFCAGDTIDINGQIFTQSGIAIDTIFGNGACDTIVTYTLTLQPQPTQAITISFCPGDSITIDGQVFTQSGTAIDTLDGIGACDTIVTYTLILLPQTALSDSISFCAGDSITINGLVYTQSGTVVDTLAGNGVCDTILTYVLTMLPILTRTDTVAFCAGDSVSIGGQIYTQPGTVIDTIAGTVGCDTIVTYVLTVVQPGPSTVSIQCPSPVNITISPGMSPVAVNYNQPTGTTDCTCPGLAFTLTSGIPSGGLFPTGTSQVCYAAQDSCGNTATCCFNVVVQEQLACDIKVSGCMQYEVVSITRDMMTQRLTYRIRVINNCANKLIYTAIQLPNGVVAKAPANQSIFLSEGNRNYEVRNPNYSPFYSIRFKSTTDSISGGSSDIFKYTLPAQSNPTFIHIISRLAPQVYYEAHLNVFDCPIMVMSPQADRDELVEMTDDQITLFPNPTDGTLWVDMSAWTNLESSLQWRILNSQGQQVMMGKTAPGENLMQLELSKTLHSGLFFFEILKENGEKETRRFVLQY